MLQGDDANTAFRDNVQNLIEDNGVAIPPPRDEEDKVENLRLKINKATVHGGPSDQLFKTGYNEFVECMHLRYAPSTGV